MNALRKMHTWVVAWGDVARTVVTRRDHQIRLGIAKRRSPRKAAPPGPIPVVVVPPPAAAPVIAPVASLAARAATDDEAPPSRAA